MFDDSLHTQQTVEDLFWFEELLLKSLGEVDEGGFTVSLLGFFIII